MGLVKKQWSDLSPRARRLVIAVSAVEGILKAAALADLARRPDDQVRGNKAAWAVALTLINAGGAVPVAYFLVGRQGSGTRS